MRFTPYFFKKNYAFKKTVGWVGFGQSWEKNLGKVQSSQQGSIRVHGHAKYNAHRNFSVSGHAISRNVQGLH